MKLNARAIASKLSPSGKQFVKMVARQTIGRIPQSRRRLTGKLAMNGGTPVRDPRFRPWGNQDSGKLPSWLFHVRPRLRKIFLTGVEGLPQPLAKQFAQQWAEYCGCRYG